MLQWLFRKQTLNQHTNHKADAHDSEAMWIRLKQWLCAESPNRLSYMKQLNRNLFHIVAIWKGEMYEGKIDKWSKYNEQLQTGVCCTATMEEWSGKHTWRVGDWKKPDINWNGQNGRIPKRHHQNWRCKRMNEWNWNCRMRRVWGEKKFHFFYIFLK